MGDPSSAQQPHHAGCSCFSKEHVMPSPNFQDQRFACDTVCTFLPQKGHLWARRVSSVSTSGRCDSLSKSDSVNRAGLRRYVAPLHAAQAHARPWGHKIPYGTPDILQEQGWACCADGEEEHRVTPHTAEGHSASHCPPWTAPEMGACFPERPRGAQTAGRPALCSGSGSDLRAMGSSPVLGSLLSLESA